jgi:hypothetical protein
MDDTKTSPKQLRPKATPERVAKESSALRANLLKRKEQARARQTDKTEIKGN